MNKNSVSTSIFVRFGDTDPYGVVYFVSYFRYCHMGIEEFLRYHGLNPEDIFRNREQKFGLPVVSAKCDFLRPVRYGQKLELQTSIKEIRSKVIIFKFHFYKPPEESIIAKGEATLVAIGPDWHSCELPAMLISKIK